MKKVALAVIAARRAASNRDTERHTERHQSLSVAQLAADVSEPLSALKQPYIDSDTENRSEKNILELTIAILSRTQNDRHESDLYQIMAFLRHKSDVFKRLRSDQLIKLLKGVELVRPVKDEVIVRQGEIGNCCFINLSGKVSIYNSNINTTGNDAAGNTSSDGNSKKCQFNYFVGDLCPKREHLGTYVVSLGAGAPFGEMALLSNDCIRKAYVVADEDMCLLMVSRDLFNSTMRLCIEEDYRDKRTFINSSAFFSKWTPDFKEQLAMALERDVLYYDQFVVKQGETADTLYFIVSGEAQVFLNPVAHEQYFRKQLYEGRETADVIRSKVRQLKYLLAHKFHKKEIMDSIDEEDDILSFENFGPNLVTSEQQLSRPYSRAGSAADKKRMVMLCVQRPVGVIGDLEYFLQLDKYSQSVMCTERTVVLKLSTRQYERLCKRNPTTTRMMMDGLKRKLQQRIDRSQTVCREVPLMKYALMKSYTLCQNYEYEQLKLERLTQSPMHGRKNRGQKSARDRQVADETRVVRNIRRDYERKALISPADRRDVTIPLEYLRLRLGNQWSSLIGLDKPFPIPAAADSMTRRPVSRAQTARTAKEVSKSFPAASESNARDKLLSRRARSAVSQARLVLQGNTSCDLEQIDFNVLPLDNSALKRNNCLMMFRNRGIYSLG